MMPTIHLNRCLHKSLKFLLNSLILIVLVFGSLPSSMAQAVGEAVPPQAPPFAPAPVVNLGIKPLEHVLIGETFDFYIIFDNSSSDKGFGPFIDLIFPFNGMDGAAGTDTPDGIEFVKAAYKNYTLNSTTLIFPDADGPILPGTTGCVDHPYALDTQGSPVSVCGTTGDKLTVLELPFSSITQGMPQLWINVTAKVSELADIDVPLTILARSGFRYGTDSLNNPGYDSVVLNPTSNDGSGWPSLEVTPKVIYIYKYYDGPKECPYLLPPFEPVIDETDCPYADLNPVYESVTGPNFPRQYNVVVEIANGQTITNLAVADYLPNNLAYLSIDSISPAGSTTVDTPTVGAAANPPDNDLAINFLSVSGSVKIAFTFFIPKLDASGYPVIDPNTGNAVLTENIASAIGDWDPVDDRDPADSDNALANGPCPDCDPLHELYLRSMAIQKSVTYLTDSHPSPGDVLEYSLAFQVSDYFSFGAVSVTDLLSDGQHVLGSFTPTLQINGNGYDMVTAVVDPVNYDISCNYTGGPGAECTTNDPAADDGTTKLVFRVSPEIITRGQNGRMVGGCVDPAGGMLTTCTSASPGDGPTMGVITFQTVIQEDFTDDFPSGDASVDHGDALLNSAVFNATVLDNDTFADLGSTNNDSAQKFEIEYGEMTKEVYAVNGSTAFTPSIQPGDTITFRLRQALPSSDSDDLILTDFLPLPIFNAAEVAIFDDVTDPTVPVAGFAKFGPSSTLNGILATPVLPIISADVTANSLSFNFGNFDDLGDTPTEIDILFTITTSNDPYADGALLTNLALGLEDTTNSHLHTHLASAQFTLKEPGISLRKGVVASTNASAIYLPNPPGPIVFNPPGSNPSWGGVIASGDQDPATNLINSDIFDVIGGNYLTFAVVLENLGSSSLGAFDISVRDTLPADLRIPPTGLNLQVRRGDGLALTFAPVGAISTDPSGWFDDGIIIDDESTSQGIAHMYDASSGANIIVVTYDLEILPDLAIGTEITNTATLLSYAGMDGAPNHVGTTATNNVHSDNAVVSLLNPAPTVVFGANTTPTDNAILSVPPDKIVVEFNKPVKSGGASVHGAADNPENYLLINPGQDGIFQTQSCAGTLQPDDERVTITSAVYRNNGGHGPFLATLSFGEPLGFGVYRLLVCGTTSIEDLDGNELNEGLWDTSINFTVSKRVMPSTGFAPGKTTMLPAQPADKAYTNQDMRLEIPALGVDRPIVGVPQTTDGWNISWLGNDIGYLQGTAFPTWEGNSVLTSHAYNSEGKAGPFAGLENLYSGQQIIIHAWGQRYIYEVRSTSKWTKPTDASAISKHEEYPWLTLITCRSYDQQSDAYLYRTVVRAVLIKVENE